MNRAGKQMFVTAVTAALGMAVALHGAGPAKGAGAKPPATPQLKFTFANAIPGDNIRSDGADYVGGVNNVFGEFTTNISAHPNTAYLSITGTAGKKKRTFGFLYPDEDNGGNVDSGCGLKGPTTAPGQVVWTQGYVEWWQIGGMQVGEIRATGVGFYANTPGQFRWMRDYLPDWSCANMVAAYRESATTWQVVTSLSRLELKAGAFGITDAAGTLLDLSDLVVPADGWASDSGSASGPPRVTQPGDVAQLGGTISTFQGNYRMPFKVVISVVSGSMPNPTCASWPCNILN